MGLSKGIKIWAVGVWDFWISSSKVIVLHEISGFLHSILYIIYIPYSRYFSRSLIFAEAISLYYSKNSWIKFSRCGKRHVESRTQTQT